MRSVVIFGGTFNPFHIGHYEMLSAVNAIENADEVWLMPDRVPPHKVCEYMAPDSDRIEMCRIAAADFEKTKLCLLEFEREGKSYTFDTVKELKKRFPDTHFSLVCGGDMIETLNTWYRWEELIKEISFYAFRRVGDTVFDKAVFSLRNMGASITCIEKEITDVSSTQIRTILSKGEQTDLLPNGIYKYIKERKLYCNGCT